MMLFLKPSIEAFRLLNVKYVLSKKDLKHEQLERVLETNGHFIYQVNNSLPRVYCASDVVQAATTDIKEIKQVIHEYNRPAVVEEHVDIVTSDCDISGLRVYTNNLNFSVRATGAALVVLPYGFHRNWHVSINDQPASITKVNYALMGVVVPRGESQVHVYYNNFWDTVHAVVLMSGTIVVLVLAFGFRGSIGKVALIVLSVLAIGKSLLSLPVVRNDKIAERPTLHEPLRVEHRVVVCE